MTGYYRPETLEDALSALSQPGAAAVGGGTDLVGQIDRAIVTPDLLVDIRSVVPHGIVSAAGGLSIGGAATLAELVESELVRPYGVLASAAAQAASALLRSVGTVGGNLCQGTRCWYFRGHEWHCWLAGGDTCFAQIGDHRKHNLQSGDCISAHPSDLAPALAACGADIVVTGIEGERTMKVPELYRRPTPENRSLLTLAPGEIVCEVRLPAPPDSSAYERLGERQAFSFPLVSVAAARHGKDVAVYASGVANIPHQVDPNDPLRDLPGNPQSAWKLRVLETLVARARAAVA